MITFEELRIWSDDLKPVLFDINVVRNNLQILSHDKSLTFRHNQNDLFQNIWYQQYFIIIVQLSKIFSPSKNQKRNINKLCNRYENDELDDTLNQILLVNSKKLTDVFWSHQDIKKAVAQLRRELTNKSVLIQKVIDLRDKVFAHTDPNPTVADITLEEILDLSDFATITYNSLFGKVLDEYYHFSLTDRWDFREIIETYNKVYAQN